MRYQAKVDWFIGLSMFCGIAVPAFIAISQSLPWMSAASLFAALLVFGVSYPQWYETTADALIIRSGLTTRRIPYSQIKAVRPVSKGRGGAPTALNRVQIDYGIGDLLIAPKDAAAFFEDIASHTPQLTRHGTELVVAVV